MSVRTCRAASSALVALMSLVACAPESRAPVATATPLGVLRTATPGPATPLGEVHLLTVHLSSGTVYVVHGDRTEIPMFDSLGESLGTIGRAGSGPGEFRGLSAIGMLGDTLWTIDSELRRITMFASDGTLISTRVYTPIPPTFGEEGPPFFAYPLLLLADGTLLGFGGTTARDIASGRITTRPHLRLTPNADTRDTIAWTPSGRGTLSLRSSAMEAFLGQPFSDETLVSYSAAPARLHVVHRDAATRADSAVIVATALDLAGDTVWTRALRYTPQPLPRDTITAARERIARNYRAFGVTEAIVEAALFAPAFRTPVSATLVGADGALWIRREEHADSTEYLVLDQRGELSAQWRLSTRSRVLWAHGDLLWGVILDDDDVPTVARLGPVQPPR